MTLKKSHKISPENKDIIIRQDNKKKIHLWSRKSAQTIIFTVRVTHDPIKTFIYELQYLVSHLDQIRAELKTLVSEKLKPGPFYTIPKLHKIQKTITGTTTHLSKENINRNPHKMNELIESLNIHPLGRQIVSGIRNQPQILKPLLPTIPSYIKTLPIS